MNWYKKSQINDPNSFEETSQKIKHMKHPEPTQEVSDFPTYLYKQIMLLTNNYRKPITYRYKKILEFVPFLQRSIIKYKIPYQTMTLEELFRVATYADDVDRDPRNLQYLPKEIQSHPIIQSLYKEKTK